MFKVDGPWSMVDRNWLKVVGRTKEVDGNVQEYYWVTVHFSEKSKAANLLPELMNIPTVTAS